MTAWKSRSALAELVALAGVLDGHVDHPSRESDELRGRAERTAVERRRDVAARRRCGVAAVGCHSTLARGAGRRRPRQRLERASRCEGTSGSRPSCRPGAADRRGPRTARPRRRATSWSRSRRRRSIGPGVGEQRHGDAGMLDERLGQRDVARLLERAARGRPDRARGRRPTPVRAAPSTPISPSADHARSVDRVVSHASRTTAGGHSLASRSRTASRNASWSSVKAKRIGLASTLARGRPSTRSAIDVALDLVRARVDRSRQRELVALHPPASRRAPHRRRAAPSAVSCRRTSSSDQNTFVRLDSAPSCSPSVMRVTVRKVCQRYAWRRSRRARPRRARRTVGRVATFTPQVDEARRRRHEAPRAAERQAALRAGRRHRDPPALVHPPSTSDVGHEHVVEEHLGEPFVAVEPTEAAHRHAGRVERHQEVGEATVALGVGIGAEQAEQVRAERAARRPGLLPREPPAASRLVGHRARSGSPRGRCPRWAPTSPDTRDPPRRPCAGGCWSCCSWVPNAKTVGARRKMPFCVTRCGPAGPVVLLLEDQPLHR